MKFKNIRVLLSTLLALTFIVALFSYFRLKPIYFQTLPYTYDQGRDFMKAAEIVLYKNLTFIGPTTGIMGVYHGAWWYYVLVIPFILFGGLPVGFYFFNFFLHFVSLLVLFYFLRKATDSITALIISAIVTVSPYFFFTSIFVGNNIMVLPALLAFVLANVYLLEKKISSSKKYLGLMAMLGISLGLVSEFEFAFGLMIIPAYIILIAVLKPLRQHFWDIKRFAVFFASLVFIFAPRLLFELKNSFSQTKVLLNFIFKPTLHNPKPYIDIVKDRIELFQNYYKSIFATEWLMYAITLGAIAILILAVKQREKMYSKSIVFLSSLLGLLFFFSTMLKDFFWANYYEGIHYVFLVLLGLILGTQLKKHNEKWMYVKAGLLLAVGVILIQNLITTIKSVPVKEGLITHQEIVDYVHSNTQNKQNYCVRVYTPPVVPHTYDYMFLYKNKSENIALPTKEWVDDTCWFILEADSYKERKDKWLEENLPKTGKKVSTKRIRDVDIELWSGK